MVCLAVFSARLSDRLHELRTSRRTEQALFKRLLVLDRLVGYLAGVVGLALGRVRVRVVLCEDARAIVNGQDQDGGHAEEGEGPRHGGQPAVGGRRAAVGGGSCGCCELPVDKVSSPPRSPISANPLLGASGKKWPQRSFATHA